MRLSFLMPGLDLGREYGLARARPFGGNGVEIECIALAGKSPS